MHFVECHRDPTEAVPSLCSLIAARKAGYYTFIDFEVVGQRATEIFEVGFERIQKARDELGSTRFSDVSYTRLMEDPFSAAWQVP